MRDISLEVRKGESIGILGRNGCGKSTLLQVICGMTLPSHGEL
ncbi:ATP-binding cassette domain-containing protein, partial [Klebsiella aerogenes]